MALKGKDSKNTNFEEIAQSGKKVFFKLDRLVFFQLVTSRIICKKNKKKNRAKLTFVDVLYYISYMYACGKRVQKMLDSVAVYSFTRKEKTQKPVVKCIS